MNVEDSALHEPSRAEAYSVLSSCYYPPDEELLGKLAKLDQSVVPSLRPLLDRIPGVEDLETLRVEHARLFIGPFELLAPPYGSVYMEGGRKLMGDSTVDVRRRYSDEGLDVILKDVPDHIAVELEFMHYLVCKGQDAMRDSDPEKLPAWIGKQRDFLGIHLGMWAPTFAIRLREKSESAFYKNLANATRAFIEGEMARLGVVALAEETTL